MHSSSPLTTQILSLEKSSSKAMNSHFAIEHKAKHDPSCSSRAPPPDSSTAAWLGQEEGPAASVRTACEQRVTVPILAGGAPRSTCPVCPSGTKGGVNTWSYHWLVAHPGLGTSLNKSLQQRLEPVPRDTTGSCS